MNHRLLAVCGLFVAVLALVSNQTVSTLAYLDSSTVSFNNNQHQSGRAQGQVLGVSTPARVQVKSGSPAGAYATSYTLTFNNPTTPGNLIAVVISDYYGGSSAFNPWTVSDNKGNPNYTLAVDNHKSSTAGNWGEQEIFYCKNCAGGASHSITVRGTPGGGSGNLWIVMTVIEYSGLDAVNPLDVTATNFVGGSAATYTSTAAAPTPGATELLLGATQWYGSTLSTAAQDSPWLKVDAVTDGLYHAQLVQDEVVNAASGSYAATGIFSPAKPNVLTTLVAFKSASGSVPDTTPPVISAIQSSGISSTGANIAWTTDENSNSQVDYGTTAAYGASSALNTAMSVSHSVALSGLSAATLYHYQVKSADAAGNLATSTDQTFTTASATDATPPSIPTGLSATAISSSQINLSWTASTDNVAVTGYRIYRGGAQIATSTVVSFTDSGLAASTPYTYTVSAFDAAGNASAQSTSASATTQAPTGGSSTVSWTNMMPHTSVWPGWNGYLTLQYDQVSQQTMLYGVVPGSASIYSTEIYFYNSSNNIWTHLGGTGSMGTTASPDCNNGSASALQPWPSDRHPGGQMAFDSKRNRLWLYGGVCSNVVPQDTWYLSLNADPSNDTWTKVPTNHIPMAGGGNGDSSMVYDSDDDVLFSYGYDVGSGSENNWVYCSTVGNPTAGVLTAKQSAAGCAAADDWTKIIPVGGVEPIAGWQYPGMVYDTVTKKVILYGGIGSTGRANETWTYDVPAKTWTRKALSTTPPPIDTQSSPHVGVAYNSVTNKLLYHHNGGVGAPADWQYDPVADTWTKMASSGSPAGPSYGCCGGLEHGLDGMTYDTKNNMLVVLSESSNGGADVWQGQLTSTAPDTQVPSVPANLSASAFSTSQINLSWTASTDNVVVTGYKIYRGGVQVATSTAVNYSDTGLTPSTTYSYTVSAFDAAGNTSAQSTSAGATTQTPLPIISSFTANPASITSGQSSTLSWNTPGAASITISPGGFSSTNINDSTTVSPATTTIYTLTATNAGGSVTAQVTVTFVPNQAPTVSAGTNQTITLPTSNVTLTGTAGDDGLPNPPGALNYSWIQTSGPATATIVSSLASTTQVTDLSAIGNYVFQLTVSDSELSSSASVTVTVNPAPDTTAPNVNLNAQDSGGQPITAGATVNGSITFTVTASDPAVSGQVNSGLSSISLLIDGAVVASSNTGSLTYTVNSQSLTSVGHEFMARAADAAGNIANSQIFQLSSLGFSASLQ